MHFCCFLSWATSFHRGLLSLCFQELVASWGEFIPRAASFALNKLLEVIAKGKITKLVEDKKIVSHSHHGHRQTESRQS